MRKLIKYSALAFLVWAITTFAWAALSHATGLVGPAEASGASLRFVASAVTFVDPPGILGAPQRLAAQQIRHAARAVERIHRGPERAAARLVDRLGHGARHGRHAGLHRHAIRIERHGRAVTIPLDELDASRERAMARARVELERHRRDLERSRSDAARHEWRSAMEARQREVEARQRERIERSAARVRSRIERIQAEQADQNGDLRRKLADRLERLRDILRDLDDELENVRVEGTAEFDADELAARIQEQIQEALEIQLDGLGDAGATDVPVRIRIRGN